MRNLSRTGRRGSGQGEPDGEEAPRPRGTAESDRPAVGLDDGAGDAESQTGSARLARPRVVEPDEGAEDPLGVGGRDAGAGVRHGQAGDVALAAERQLDLAPGGRV